MANEIETAAAFNLIKLEIIPVVARTNALDVASALAEVILVDAPSLILAVSLKSDALLCDVSAKIINSEQTRVTKNISILFFIN